jgi:hypothetical protein
METFITILAFAVIMLIAGLALHAVWRSRE